MTSVTGGQKGTKLARFDLIPTRPLWLLAELYGQGAKKYADNNWRKGYDWSLSYAAAQRHMNMFWAGEDIDPEMGVPHTVCAMFHMMALTEYLTTHPAFDNRPKPVVAAFECAHQWVDVTGFADTQSVFVCSICDKSCREPFAIPYLDN